MSSSPPPPPPSSSSSTVLPPHPSFKRAKPTSGGGGEDDSTSVRRGLHEIQALLTNTVEKRLELSSEELTRRETQVHERMQKLFALLQSLRRSSPVGVVPKRVPSSELVKWTLFFDGGSRGNPGVAGSGWCLYHNANNSLLVCGWKYVGADQTNNVAEFTGLLEGMTYAKEKATTDALRVHLAVQGDSLLVINQCNKQWACKAEHLKPLLKQARFLIDSFPGEVNLTHVAREDNACADYLSNVAMDTRASDNITMSGETTTTTSQVTVQYLKSIVARR